MSHNALQVLEQTLNDTFVGPLAHLQGLLAFGDRTDRAALSVSEILSDAHLEAMVVVFAHSYGETPPAAVHSIWSKWYFATVLPPLICSSVLIGTLPPCRLEDVRLLLADDYKIARVFVLDGTPTHARAGAEERFRPLLEDNIAPFIALFHRRTGVSLRVLWSNAGNLFEGVVRHLEKIGTTAAGVDDGDAFLRLATLHDGRRNRLFKPIVYRMMGRERVRRRRVCCLRYLLPDNALCCACPRHEQKAALPGLPAAHVEGTGQ